MPYSVESCARRRNDLLGANGLTECYIRPIAFSGYGQLGVSARDNPVETVIMSWPWGTYLGEDGAPERDADEDLQLAAVAAERRSRTPRRRRASTSTRCSPSARRSAPATTRRSCSPPTATSRTARARRSSSSEGQVLYTPDLSAGILVGITRDSVIQIAQDLGYEVVEKTLIRSDLYLADEVFMCGTAAEVTPMREVDDHDIGPPGPDHARRSRRRTSTRANGRKERWAQWLELRAAAARSA